MMIDIENVKIDRNGISCPTCGGKLEKVETKTFISRLRDSLRLGKKPLRYRCEACEDMLVIYTVPRR